MQIDLSATDVPDLTELNSVEKIYVKPVSREIITKNGSSDGYCDIFSYEPDSGEEFKKRGSLFVVGHVRHESEDLAYIVNLISALAKREYYAKPTLVAREAFANALRKINEVVEEFFRNKDLEMNIGVFAIAADQILISKLGKFKIVMARDGKNVDILNNVELFEKEHIQSKEFCNIISGKIQKDDRILAFYPGKPVTAREKYLKDDFLQLPEIDFATKVNDLKTKNEQFSCTLLYVTMKEFTEIPTLPKIEPQELINAQLASQNLAENHTGRQAATTNTNGVIATETPKSRKRTKTELATPSSSSIPTAVKTEYVPTGQEKPTATAIATPHTKPIDVPITPEVVPRIIPSEFSLGRRKSMFANVSKRFRLPGLSINLKSRYAVIVVVLAVLVGTGFLVKTFFLVDPQNRQLSEILSAAQANLKTAREKLSQNDSVGARNLLLGSINNIRTFNSDSSKAAATNNELVGALDNIDKAQEMVPSLIAQLPADNGQAELIGADDNGLHVYTFAAQTNSGYLYRITDNAVAEQKELREMHPTLLLPNGTSLIAVDLSAGKLGLAKGTALAIVTLELPSSARSAWMYQDNLYVLADNGISKITDAAKGAIESTTWLASGTTVPADSLRIAVDGNAYVLSRDGMIITFYKGKPLNQFQAPFAPDANTWMLTTPSSPLLLLVNSIANRIYALDKQSGILTQTYKLGTTEKIISATVGADNTLYFLTADNKIWGIK